MIHDISAWIDQAIAALDKLNGMPAVALVLCFAWLIGWVLKRLPVVPNQSIPALVVLSAGIVNVLLSDFQNSGLPFRIWLFKNFIVGMIIGGIAWVSHRYLWKTFLNYISSKFPDAAKDFETKPPFPETNGGSAQPSKPTETKGIEEMKKLIIIAGISMSLMLPAMAQESTNLPPDAPTFSGPAWELLNFLGTGSNWMAATYGIANMSEKKFGGGIAVGYKVSEYVAPIMRLDYYDGQVWMPSGSLQLQAPLTIMGKLTVIPFAFTGLATPIAGKGGANGSAVGIFGIGGALRIANHWDIVGDYEKWTGFKGNQVRFGVLYKF